MTNIINICKIALAFSTYKKLEVKVILLRYRCRTQVNTYDLCASGSAVEHLLAKEGVAGSIPVSRSKKTTDVSKWGIRCFLQIFCFKLPG